MTSVALVGPDGAGKTTVARLVGDALPEAAYLYCGTNPEMGDLLWTTRVAARLRGGVSHGVPMAAGPSHRQPLVAWVRTVVWLTEELARGRKARSLARDAPLVLRDRDFLVDRLAMPGDHPAHERFHRWVLARWYPAPDTTVVLDVDPAVAFARKGELDPDELAQRRAGYRALGDVLPDVVVVDAGRAPDQVAADVVAIASARRDARPPS